MLRSNKQEISVIADWNSRMGQKNVSKATINQIWKFIWWFCLMWFKSLLFCVFCIAQAKGNCAVDRSISQHFEWCRKKHIMISQCRLFTQVNEALVGHLCRAVHFADLFVISFVKCDQIWWNLWHSLLTVGCWNLSVFRPGAPKCCRSYIYVLCVVFHCWGLLTASIWSRIFWKTITLVFQGGSLPRLTFFGTVYTT